MITPAHQGISLLGASAIRDLAARHGIRPTKTLGQNFVIDANTVRRIARVAELEPDQVVLEVGPGLGSLTLALLEACQQVVAVEIDPVLAAALPATIAAAAPQRAGDVTVIQSDAMQVTQLPGDPTAFVANLPYNVAVPVLLTLLERFAGLRTGVVMVQAEVADRLAARAGEKAYGAPSAKAAWYADVRRAGSVGRSVFWPVPGVDSALVGFRRHSGIDTPAAREQVFAVIDAAFAQRRKTLRSALATWAGSPVRSEQILRAAGIDPRTRGEQLGVAEFAAIACAAATVPRGAAANPATGEIPVTPAD